MQYSVMEHVSIFCIQSACTHLCIGGVKQPLWDLQPLSTEVTVVAVGQLIVHSGHLCSNSDERERG